MTRRTEPIRAAALCVALLLLAPPCLAQPHEDALRTLDRSISAAVVQDVCQFDLDLVPAPSREDLDAVGSAAYDRLLADLERTHPGAPDNRRDAEFAFRRRMEAGVTEARRTTIPADCPRLEAETRAAFEALRRR